MPKTPKKSTNFLPIGLYIENASHKMPRKFLDEKTYAQAIAAFVVVCTDIILINRKKRLFYLAKRRVKPQQHWWVIGGRSFAGELPEDAAKRCLQRETSLIIAKSRLRLIKINRYLFKSRQQKPQNIGVDLIGYTFILEATSKELALASASLDTNEYESLGLQAFNYKRMKKEKVHPMLLDLYNQLFN